MWCYITVILLYGLIGEPSAIFIFGVDPTFCNKLNRMWRISKTFAAF